jgi:hypothetical protein
MESDGNFYMQGKEGKHNGELDEVCAMADGEVVRGFA